MRQGRFEDRSLAYARCSRLSTCGGFRQPVLLLLIAPNRANGWVRAEEFWPSRNIDDHSLHCHHVPFLLCVHMIASPPGCDLSHKSAIVLESSFLPTTARLLESNILFSDGSRPGLSENIPFGVGNLPLLGKPSGEKRSYVLFPRFSSFGKVMSDPC